MQTVPADDPRVAEIEAHRVLLRHVANLRRIALVSERQSYIANVERKEGPEAAAALRDEFKAIWAALMAERGAPD